MKRRICILFVLIWAVTSMAWAGSDRGSKDIDIDAGYKGQVGLPHHDHQDELKDCSVCHSVFPKKSGAIGELVDQGKLARKQVMNDVCRKCHKERKAAGLETGPIACAKCHK